MAEVGLPTSLNTRAITCLTINGAPYVPGGGFVPEYVETVASVGQAVGAGGSVILPLGAVTLNSGDFVQTNATTLELQPSSASGSFVISATIQVATSAAVTPGAPSTSILQILKNGAVVPNSATYISVWEPLPFAFPQNTTTITGLNVGDTIQIQLVSTDPLLITVPSAAVPGPPPLAAMPGLIVDIERFA
jgi:hypothetical protein